MALRDRVLARGRRRRICRRRYRQATRRPELADPVWHPHDRDRRFDAEEARGRRRSINPPDGYDRSATDADAGRHRLRGRPARRLLWHRRWLSDRSRPDARNGHADDHRHRHLAGRRRRLWRFDRDQLRMVRAGRLATGRSVHRGRPVGRIDRDRSRQIDRLARQGVTISLRRHRHSRRRLRLPARGACRFCKRDGRSTESKRAARRAALFSPFISLEPTPPRASGPAQRRGLRRRPGLRTWQSSSGTCRPAHARSCRTRPCPSRC